MAPALVIFTAPSACANFGIPKIDDLDEVALTRLLLENEDVVGLEIAVRDAGCVSGSQPVEQLRHQRRHLRRGHLIELRDSPAHRLAVEELHHDEPLAVRERADIEHLEDVVVADAARGLRFALEALDDFGVLGHGRVQHLDGDTPLDAGVLAQVDGAHAAFPDASQHLVLSVDDAARLQGHETRSPELSPDASIAAARGERDPAPLAAVLAPSARPPRRGRPARAKPA